LQEFFLQVHITNRCNLRCVHCYGSAQEPRDLSLDEFRRVTEQLISLTQLLAPQRRWIQLTGGEPLLNPGFQRMMEFAVEHVGSVRLLSNGFSIDQSAATRFAELRVSVQLSFDGLRENHDRWRGDGAFDAALRAAEILRSAGVRVVARMTVSRANQDDILPLCDLLRERTDLFSVARVVPIGDCEAGAQPDVEVYRRALYGLYGRRLEGERISLREPFFGPIIAVDQPDTRFEGCSAGRTGLTVLENGDVLPCRRLPIVLGNVLTDDLAGIYFGHPLLRALRERNLDGRCGVCEDKRRCGGARCIANALNGNPLSEDPGCIFHVSRREEP